MCDPGGESRLKSEIFGSEILVPSKRVKAVEKLDGTHRKGPVYSSHINIKKYQNALRKLEGTHRAQTSITEVNKF